MQIHTCTQNPTRYDNLPSLKSNEVYLLMEERMTGAGFLCQFAAGQNELLESGKMEEIMHCVVILQQTLWPCSLESFSGLSWISKPGCMLTYECHSRICFPWQHWGLCGLIT